MLWINRAVHTILSEILLTNWIVWEFAVWLVQNTCSGCVLVRNLLFKRGTAVSHARSGRVSCAFCGVWSCCFGVNPAKKKMKLKQFSFSWSPTFAEWLWVLKSKVRRVWRQERVCVRLMCSQSTLISDQLFSHKEYMIWIRYWNAGSWWRGSRTSSNGQKTSCCWSLLNAVIHVTTWLRYRMARRRYFMSIKVHDGKEKISDIN